MPWLCIVVTRVSEPVKLVPVAALSLARPSGCPELARGRRRSFKKVTSIVFVFLFVFVVVSVFVFV